MYWYFLFLFLCSLIKHYSFGDCPFAVEEQDSGNYMSEYQQLGKVPHRVPAFLNLSTPLQISMILIQTNENYEIPLRMYETIINNIEMNPEFEYRFYNGTERRNFMKQMGGDYLKVYDTLKPNAYKADVFRYTVIYHYGGCYMDAGSISVQPLAEMLKPTDQFVSSDDTQGKGLNSAFFCAIKGSKVLEKAIEIIFQAVLSHNYGNSDLNITGPFKFLQGLQKYLVNPNFTLAKPGNFGKGVRLLWRQIHFRCLIAEIQDENQVYVISKYPAYIADMRRYTKLPRYGFYWKQRRVFKSSTIDGQDDQSSEQD